MTVIEFSHFDRRGYPTVSVREGYRAWLPSYERTVEDEMDFALLDALETMAWPAVRCAADLGCGTGRTGAWLRSHGIARLDGIDLTPEMLAVAAVVTSTTISLKPTSPRRVSRAMSMIS